MMSQNELKQIAFYGKGGVGKSTISTNIAACFAEKEIKTLLLGCSPKTDSTYLLLGKICKPTLLNAIRENGSKLEVIEGCIQDGFKGVLCAETGGPEPASGCAGRGVFYTLSALKSSGVIKKRDISLVIYDVIADVVCGGFSLPMREEFSSLIFIVTTAEFMSLYAANNICLAVQNNGSSKNNTKIGGLILSSRGIVDEYKISMDFSEKINLPLLGVIPWSELVQKAEQEKGIVLQHYPDSEIANQFRILAEAMLNCRGQIPSPMSTENCIKYISSISNKFQVNTPEMEGNISLDNKNDYPTIKPDFNHNILTLERSIEPRQVSIYGKAGIGKSTISANLSAAISEMGETVLQVGCDPKRDSVLNLTHYLVPTVMEKIREHEDSHTKGSLDLNEVIFQGYNNVFCAEAGGPPPGVGCAGQGVFVALEYLRMMKVFEKYGITFSLFDVLGDVVCGGFAQPIRGGYCQEIYIVTNGEPLSLLVANNILKAVIKLRNEGVNVGVAGFIVNEKNEINERKIVEAFSEKVGVPVIAYIPRSSLVQRAESINQTVVETFSESDQAMVYKRLANEVLRNTSLFLPSPLIGSEEVFNLIRTISE